MPVDWNLLQKELEKVVSKYQNISYLETDPICFPKEYQNPLDIEIVSFISCLFAYGNVKQIQKFLAPLFRSMGPSPSLWLQKTNLQSDPTSLFTTGYRFQTKEDLLVFFTTLQRILIETKSSSPLLESYFLNEGGSFDPKSSIPQFQTFWEQELLKTLAGKPMSYGLQFLIDKPESKSPKKRISLFLRWMVRKEYPDFGIYKRILPSVIPYPLDVHIQKLSKVLGIQSLHTFQMKDAYRLTEYFKEINPDDPLLYDFYLTRVGIIEKCKGKFVEEICLGCELKQVCLVVPRGIEPRLQG